MSSAMVVMNTQNLNVMNVMRMKTNKSQIVKMAKFRRKEAEKLELKKRIKQQINNDKRGKC